MTSDEYASRAEELQEESMLQLIREALERGVPDDGVVTWIEPRIGELNEAAANRWADWFMEDAQALLDSEHQQDADFLAGLSGYWGDGLAMFYLVCRQSADLAQWFSELERQSAEMEDDPLFLAQRNLQARSCRTAFEVQYLMAGGFAAAAGARARTAYELAVISTAIDSSRDSWETARRFNEHVASEALADRQALYRVVSPNQDESKMLASLEQHVSELDRKYGRHYSGPWGWAAHLVKGRVTFQALEQLTDFAEMRVVYKHLCHPVHAGASGTDAVIEWFPGGSILAVARSDQLSSIPATVALSCLDQVTRAFLRSRPMSGDSRRALCWAAGIAQVGERAGTEFRAREVQMAAEIDRLRALEGDG